MEMNLIELLKERRESLKIKKQERLEIEKNQLTMALTTPWNEDYLRRYKRMLTVATTGALGNNSTEVDIKKMILASNRNLFSKEEYDELSEKLDLQKGRSVFAKKK